MDVAIVGGGIVGLAHAWTAARNGHSVQVFERDNRALGASVRNFGMVWPIGQPPGRCWKLAEITRQHWLDASEAAGFWIRKCGSIHLARRGDEQRVLEEFCSLDEEPNRSCRLLTPSEIQAISPAVRVDGLLAGMWSPHELCVDPRQVLGKLGCWLEDRFAVRIRYSEAVRAVEETALRLATGERVEVDRIVIASGSDFGTLYPDLFRKSPLVRCQLQMLKTVAQPDGWRNGPHLASGLTLQHSPSFKECPSLKDLQRRIATELPEVKRYGIHVLAAQNQHGEMILGDSHEYGDSVDPFYRGEIEQVILAQLRSLITLKTWEVAERWIGVYSKHPADIFFEHEPTPGVKIVTGLGGAGMTLAFGVADDVWHRW